MPDSDGTQWIPNSIMHQTGLIVGKWMGRLHDGIGRRFAPGANGFASVVPTLAAKAAARVGHPHFSLGEGNHGLGCATRPESQYQKGNAPDDAANQSIF
jgi:hypothetical protein